MIKYPCGTEIANLNPLRYRGYYFDTETGYYYLNARYYDAEWGRFINADAYVSTGQGLTSYNMYAYCLNNPVSGYDPLGTRTISIGWGFSCYVFAGMSYSISLSFDSYGNVALQTSKANVFKNQEGLAMGIASIGVSSSLSGTSLDSIDDLEGISINAGVNSVDLILDEDLNITGGGISASASVGSPVDIHMVASTTTAHYKANPFEAIKNTWGKFTKWLRGVFS